MFTWWTSASYQATEKSLQAFSAFLQKLSAERSGGDAYAIRAPVGREVLVQELAFEMLPYSPEEILAIGWQELALCKKERLKATQELGYGDNWQEAMEHVKNLCVEPGKLPELIRFLTYEAIDFLEKHDSLTIPPMVKQLLRTHHLLYKLPTRADVG